MVFRNVLVASGVALVACSLLRAQETTPPPERRIEVEPEALRMNVGEKAHLNARVVDAAGNALEENLFFFSRTRRTAQVDFEGNVEALQVGEATIVVRTAQRGAERLTREVSVTVLPPPLARLAIEGAPERMLEGTSLELHARGFDAEGDERVLHGVRWSVQAPDTQAGRATVDEHGVVQADGVGWVTIEAESESFGAGRTIEIVPNPVHSLDVTLSATTVRTGDVVHVGAVAHDAQGKVVADAPIEFAFEAHPDDTRGPGASAQIEPDGRFVACLPGRYTIVARCGSRCGRASLRVNERNVRQRLEFVGHGPVHDMHTSDLWVWQGVDGRDYAVTGTWGANGDAIFWDVTDPTNIERIATITVDARTVNDVKVSPDGTLCVISREGASNRKNGIVLIDVKNPRDPEIVSMYDENLTGGVHNVFIDGNQVYALSAGRRYDVIDVAKPAAPGRVGEFELDTPGHSIHDVWVVDGIAYSSNWGDGIQIVDVGNGVAGGTRENPVAMSSYAYPTGWNHAAFPYKNEQTGKFYVVAGDEAFPFGLHVVDKPTYPRGWIHFIDFTDLKHPSEVARYQVPEAGTHNLWIEDDVLYVAYYNAGLRVVDVSGELLGNLYDQGREIAFVLPEHHEGHIANAAMTWGPQPYKGVIYVSDWNSGLWAYRLVPETPGRPR
ncbi:MAG: hypothetical protein H6834_12115 [Planctomycetes bacterium]|nr:hypothetical protein [Planctomycetota bacterium]